MTPVINEAFTNSSSQRSCDIASAVIMIHIRTCNDFSLQQYYVPKHCSYCIVWRRREYPTGPGGRRINMLCYELFVSKPKQKLHCQKLQQIKGACDGHMFADVV